MSEKHHHHHHHHEPHHTGKIFALSILLNSGFVAFELTYGFISNSIALLADASHNLSDVLSLLLAWAADTLSKKSPSQNFTYGFRSSSILAALFNALLLLLVTGGIAWEALQRLIAGPHPVQESSMIIVAGVGILINSITAWLFMSGRKKDLNIRAAFLHMATDALVSLGVVLAGFGILLTGWYWLDATVSLLIVAIILASTTLFLWEATKLALHAVPKGIDASQVKRYLASLSGVCEVHDLHIWGMSTTETALTAHLIMPQGHAGDEFLDQITKDLHDRFHIGHATIQIETGHPHYPCALASEKVV